MTRRTLLTSTALAALGVASALAGPDGANVVGGSATISGQGGASVTINQTSERAVINWRQFDIGPGETTRFNQPNSSSVALNRVTGGLGASQIMGTLSANGRVFVVNRDGILIGPNAKIDTAGFLATTNDIRDADFMAGRYNFNIPGRPDASIVNHGTITAHSAGFAALVAPGVRNTGTITATLGTVGLASGNSFTLDFYGDRLITLAVGDSIGTTVRDVQTGQPLNSLVENVGRIQANGGRVELTAVEARRVVDSVINNRGVVEANTVGTRGGTIVLGAATHRHVDSPRQTVRVSGTLSATAPKNAKNAKIKDGSGEGGRVIVTGENIEVAGARIDVSGPARGGTVLIGGDWAGGNPNTGAVSHERARLESQAIPNAATVTVDSATVIDASATDNGNAGKVIVWADGATSFRGTILATGGPDGGNGGFVEVSGHQFLDYRGTVDTRAPRGATGTLLLDPVNMTVWSGVGSPPSGSSVTSTQLQNDLLTNNVVVTTDGPATDPGNITVAMGTTVTWANNTTLTFSAHGNVQFNDNSLISNTGAGNFIVRADSQGTGTGTIAFQQFTMGSRVDWTNSTGNVSFYYNPTGGYTSPTDFTPTGQGGGTRGVTTATAGQFTPYMLVNSGANLQSIGQTTFTLSQRYALGTDVNAGVGFNGFPTGTTFAGTLDGFGGIGPNRTISNLNIAGTGSQLGMFPIIGATGTVRNLQLTSVNVTGTGSSQRVGALAGENSGTITNVVVGGSVSGTSSDIGGLVGRNQTGGTISSSQAAVVVTANPTGAADVFAGGLVGDNRGAITNSNASGNVSGTGGDSLVGGLVGAVGIGATIDNSSASGNVNLTTSFLANAGGLAGASGGTITNSQASGAVEVNAQNGLVGGLVGFNIGTVANSSTAATATVTGHGTNSFVGGLVGANGVLNNAVGTITNSSASGAVNITGLFSIAGGLVGLNAAGSTITNGRAFGNVTSTANGTNQNDSTSAGGLVGQNAGTITSPNTPVQNDPCSGGRSCATGAVSVGAHGTGGGLVGFNMGTITNSFAIGAVGTNANGISENAFTHLGGLVGASPGTISNSFASGNINTSAFSFVMAGGLVGDHGGTTTNSRAFGNVTVGNQSEAGGLVGANSPFDNCQNCPASITNSHAFGNVTAGANAVVGGLAASSAGALTDVSASGNVTAGGNSLVGGLVGALSLEGGSLANGTATGSVTSTGPNSMVGGLAGGNAGPITGSSASGAVSATDNSLVGGLVGFNLGSITGSTTAATSTVTVTGTHSLVGGLVGANAGTIQQGSNAAGNVNGGGDSAVGGLVGANVVLVGVPPGNPIPGSSFPVGTITGSSATGAVTGGDGSMVGGLIGYNNASISGLSAANNVTGGSGTTVGGLVGANGGPLFVPALPGVLAGCNAPVCMLLQNASVSTDPGTIANSTASGAVTGAGGSTVGGFVGFNPVDGTISTSQATGTANVQGGSVAGGFAGVNDGTISGSSSTRPVTVTSPTLADLTAGGFVGENNGTITTSSASGVVSGTGELVFLGGFVGTNSGLISGSSATGNGSVNALFGTIGGFAGANDGQISQSSSTGTVTAAGQLAFAGGFVGVNIGAAESSSATGAVNVSGVTTAIAGGFAGLNLGSLTGVSATGAGTGGDTVFLGGLVGWNLLGSIDGSFATGAVTAGSMSVAGELVAVNAGAIRTSFATGAVTGGSDSILGGLAAVNVGIDPNASASLQAPNAPAIIDPADIGTIRQSYSTSPVTGGANSIAGGLVAVNGGLINETYSAGLVQGGSGSTLGGLVAINNGSFTVPGIIPISGDFPTLNGTVTASYWDTSASGQVNSAAGTGLTTAQFAAGLPPGFDSSVWNKLPTSYPFLTDPLPPQPGFPELPPVQPVPPIPTPPNPLPPINPTTPDIPVNIPLNNILPPPSALVVANLVQQPDTSPTVQGPIVDTTQTTQTTQTQNNQPRGNQRPQGTQGANTGPVRPDGRPSNVPPLNETRLINDQVVVQIGVGVSMDVLNRVIRRLNLSVLSSQTLSLLGTRVIQFQIGSGRSVRDVIIELEKQKVIDEATPNYQFLLAQNTTTDAPAGDPAQYIISKLNLAEAHRISTGENVLIAVIDSEIDSKHPDLEGRIANRFDAVGPADKPHPHGTGMAGAIASHKKLMGVAPGARILAIRAFGTGAGGAQGTTVQIVKGLDWAISQGARIVNMSFAGPRDPTLAKAFQAAAAKKVVLIAAAGNAGPKSPPLFPGAEAGVIAVSATDADDNVYTNANRGKYVTVAAPGVDILVPAPEGGYEFTTGTSVAAAHVSGVAALLLQRDPKLDPAALRDILTSTAKQLGKTQGGRNDETGAGLVDPVKALQTLGAKSAGVVPATTGSARN